MTIIEPNKKNTKAKLLVFSILLVVFGGAFFSISIYNETVELKHKFSKMNRELYETEVVNAELKNKLYSLLDVRNMKNLVEGKGLILDKNPGYLEFNSDELASNLPPRVE